MKTFYNQFVTDLKETDPSKWYTMAKKIGAVNQSDSERVNVECLENFDDQEAVEAVAQHFASISQEYEPLSVQTYLAIFKLKNPLRWMNSPFI